MIKFTESDFAEVYKESEHFRETTSKALFNDFEFTRNRQAILPDGQGETLELNQVVDIFINSGAKFQSKKDFKEIKVQDFIRELVGLLNEYPQFTSARLKTYLFYFFKLLHKKNSSYGITEDYLKNILTYDRESKKLLHKNYMVALVIERQDEKPWEIKDVIQREKPISYELGLDTYLSDVILWDANNVNLHLEELTSEEIEHLRQEFKNCIIKTGAEIKTIIMYTQSYRCQ